MSREMRSDVTPQRSERYFRSNMVLVVTPKGEATVRIGREAYVFGELRTSLYSAL